MGDELWFTLRQTLRIRLSGKVLDVGAADGRNFGLFKELGAETIFMVEPNEARLKEALKTGIGPENCFPCRIYDLPPELAGTFDYAMAFQLAVNFDERLDFFKAIASMLKKPDGIVIYTVSENELIHSYNNAAVQAGLFHTQKIALQHEQNSYPNNNIFVAYNYDMLEKKK